jgi:hypothetical protein
MLKKEEKRFLYRAHALAVAGSFTKPHNEHMEAQAGSALSITGGVASGRVENFRHRDIVSFSSAYTQVVGTEGSGEGDYTTLTTATIEGLNIMGVLRADLVVARMALHHYMDGREASVLTIGSHIDGLKIAGHPVDLEHDPEILSTWDTFSKAADGHRARGVRVAGDIIPCSMMRKVSSPPGLTVDRHRIDFPEFGSIYLGEMFVKDGHRRLTMMRVELGCSTDGSVTIGDVDGNGTPAPPV